MNVFGNDMGLKTVVTNKKAYVFIFFAALTITFHITGRWLMSLYGLDPPYVYHNTGLLLWGGSYVMGLRVLISLLLCYVIRK